MTEAARVPPTPPRDYRKKPVVIQAVQWLGGDYSHLEAFCGRNWNRADAVDEAGPADKENVVVWNALEKQWLNVLVGSWIIRGVKGEFYPCKPDIFAATYEAVSEGASPTLREWTRCPQCEALHTVERVGPLRDFVAPRGGSGLTVERLAALLTEACSQTGDWHTRAVWLLGRLQGDQT